MYHMHGCVQLFAALYNMVFPTRDPEDMAIEQQRAKELLLGNCEDWVEREMRQYRCNKTMQAWQEARVRQELEAQQRRHVLRVLKGRMAQQQLTGRQGPKARRGFNVQPGLKAGQGLKARKGFKVQQGLKKWLRRMERHGSKVRKGPK